MLRNERCTRGATIDKLENYRLWWKTVERQGAMVIFSSANKIILLLFFFNFISIKKIIKLSFFVLVHLNTALVFVSIYLCLMFRGSGDHTAFILYVDSVIYNLHVSNKKVVKHITCVYLWEKLSPLHLPDVFTDLHLRFVHKFRWAKSRVFSLFWTINICMKCSCYFILGWECGFTLLSIKAMLLANQWSIWTLSVTVAVQFLSPPV